MQFTVPGPGCTPTVTSQSFVTPSLGYVLANTGQVLVTNDAGATFSGNSRPLPGTAGGRRGRDGDRHRLHLGDPRRTRWWAGTSSGRPTAPEAGRASNRRGGIELGRLPRQQQRLRGGCELDRAEDDRRRGDVDSVPVTGAGGPYNFLKDPLCEHHAVPARPREQHRARAHRQRRHHWRVHVVRQHADQRGGVRRAPLRRWPERPTGRCSPRPTAATPGPRSARASASS